MTVSDFDKCSNCGACVNVCPANAITIKSDGLFYTLSVDKEKCADCGKCAEICPTNHRRNRQCIIAAYAARHKDKKLVRLSSSGGVFTALADMILGENGAVFGAYFNAEKHSVEISSTDDVPLDELRRSKYVESNVGEAFGRVKAALSQGRKVLYCGSPCQVAGLYSFLDKEYENLLTCDFTCGGFASHRMFDEYLRHLENEYGSRVKTVNFRPKTYGWRQYAIKIEFENGREYLRPAKLDPYFSSFLFEQYTIRESCLNCEFAGDHYADIVLADFWRVAEFCGVEDDNTGISLVLSNSPKGEQAIKSVGDSLIFEPLPVEKAGYNLKPHAVKDGYKENRAKFMAEYEQNGIIKAGYEFCQAKGVSAAKLKLKSLVKKGLYSD